MAEVRIALLGAGSMGTVHAAAYAAMPDVSVVGVFSRDPARAAAVAAICKAQPFTDAAQLIQRADIDAIDVCLPSANHHDVVVPALEAGKHVFCESPLALDLDQAQRMRDAARRAGRLLQVGLLMRSVSAYGHVEAVARSGEHGRLLSVTTWRLGSYLHADAPDRKAHYGDPSTELMTFDFDFVHWLMGPPQSLSASAARMPDGRPGEISALLTYPDRPSRDRHRQRTDADRLALHHRLPRPVRTRRLRASGHLQRRSAEDELHRYRRHDGRLVPCRWPIATPTRSSCSVSSTASRAVPTRRCSMPIGPSRRCVCR